MLNAPKIFTVSEWMPPPKRLQYRTYGLAKVRGKFMAALVPKLYRRVIKRFKDDEAWSELSTSAPLLFMEAAFECMRKFESDVLSLIDLEC